MSKSAKLRARANRALNGVKDQILKSRIAAEEVLALQVSKRLRQKEDYGAIVDKYKEENERLRSRLEKLERKEKGITEANLVHCFNRAAVENPDRENGVNLCFSDAGGQHSVGAKHK